MSGMSRTILVVVALSFLALFQNCTKSDIHVDSDVSKSAASGGGNGEPYSGKVTLYHSYTPGFTCVNDAGEAVPSPFMVIQELAGVFRLVERACIKINQAIPEADITVGMDGTIQYQSMSLQPVIDAKDFIKKDYFFPEVSCKETDKSRIERTFGYYPISQIEMPNAITDVYSVNIQSNYYGEKTAKVIKKESVRVFNPDNGGLEVVFHLGPVLFESVANITTYLTQNQRFILSVQNMGSSLSPTVPGALDFSSYNVKGAELECSVILMPRQ